MTQRKRLDYIDLLEFIAIFIVLINHDTTYQYDFSASPAAITYFNYFFRSLHAAAVPLFFFANGYLLFNREFDLKKHVLRTIRLVVLTVIWGLINVLLLMLIDQHFLSLKEILVTVWTWKQGWINHFWFMGVLICFYLLFPVLKSAFDFNKSAFRFFVIVCALMTFGNKLICAFGTIAAHALIGYPEQILDNVFNMFNPFRGVYIWFAFVYFCAGGLAHGFVPTIEKHRKQFNLSAIVLIPASMLGLTGWGIYLTRLNGVLWGIVWGGQDSVFALIIVVAVFVLCLNYKPKDSRLKTLIYLVSSNTLGIYFLHELFIHMTLRHIRNVVWMQNIFGSIITAAGIMILSLLAALVIKKIPVVKKLLIS